MINSLRKKYEKTFTEFVGTVGARAFAHGRQAMVILLKALDIKEGDKVGVCGYTCISVAEAVKVCGAIPVYLDVDENLCIEPREILRQKPGEIKVVILQHTFGVPGQLEELLKACDKIGAKVIEDCAHALGCSWKGRPLGQFGQGAIYSFEWGKPYTTGQGGMLTVNSIQILEKVDDLIKSFASPVSLWNQLILRFERYLYPILGRSKIGGYVFRICNILRLVDFTTTHAAGPEGGICFSHGYIRIQDKWTAAVGLRRLHEWPQLMQLRRDNTAMIEQHLKNADLALWPRPEDANVTLLVYPIMVSCKTELLQEARRLKLDITVWYESPVNPLKGNDLSKVNYYMGMCPKAEDMIRYLVYLPTGPGLNRQKLQQTFSVVKSLIKKTT
ncbi:MAG: DegT/DnrJ/EryC1/StrS aminotransferase family protein [Sedimentisphaerales bacterium]|jgi:dTDP-4-amino-4,6-dideoxygalactose transaminase